MNDSQVPRRFRTGRRRRLSLGVAAAIAAGVLGAPALAAGHAQAASQTVLHPEWVDGCEGCPGPSVYVAAELDRYAQYVATAGIGDGLAGLIAARAERDPDVAVRLRGVAVDSFARATEATGYSTFGAAAEWDGELCPRPWPWPWPWPPRPGWEDIEQQLADGLNLLGEAAVAQDAERAAVLRGKAESSLDSAAAGLQTYESCV